MITTIYFDRHFYVLYAFLLHTSHNYYDYYDHIISNNLLSSSL